MEVFYGAVEISGSRCGVEGCDAEPVAVPYTDSYVGGDPACGGSAREHADELRPTISQLLSG